MKIEDYSIGRGKLIVKRDIKEEVTKSGLYIPNQSRDDEKMGKVVLLGPPRDTDFLPGIGIGSQVSFFKYMKELDYFGQKYLFIDENDIILYTKT